MRKRLGKVRLKLITGGAGMNYVKYAIGEIILVVIGILIALQINNWNEQRKADAEELLLLKQLQSDVVSNLNEVVELDKRLRINKKGIDSLIVRMDNKHYDILVPVYVALALRKASFNYASSGYNLMQNGKATLISDDDVLKSVLNLYENDLPDIVDRQRDLNENIDFLQRNFINKLFTLAPNNLNIQFKELDVVATDLFEPLDFGAVAENIELKNTLFQLGKLVEARLAYLSSTESNLEQTRTLLTAELPPE